MPLTLPDGVLGMADRGPDWAAWVESLPGQVSDLMEEWGLEPDGIPMHGFVGLVLPVLADGRTAVLKISFPEDETEHEHLALRRWGGRSAAALLRADPHRRALLLDRLGPRKLTEIDDEEACRQVALRYADLHVPASPQFRRLSEVATEWGEQLRSLPRSAPLPHRLVQQAVSLARDLAADPDTDGTLVHGDLHGDNVLETPDDKRDYTGDWVVIDPKPLNGDPHLEPAPMLWNRWDEAVETGDLRETVRRRFFTIVDTAGLDEDRARDWTVLRLVVLGLHQLQEPTPSEELVTTAVTVAKAVQGED
jgi:streptomycin 6-kinase